jgi:hypothetical protein
MAVFWDVAHAVWWILGDGCFGGTYCLHHQGDDFIEFFVKSFGDV